MRRQARSTNPLRATLLAMAAVVAVLLALPGAGAYAAWHTSTPLGGTVTTGSLGIATDMLPGGSWAKDGSWFDPWSGKVTAGSTLVYTMWDVPVTAVGNNLKASFEQGVTGAVLPDSIKDHVHLSVTSDPATIQGATSEAGAQRTVTLRLTLTADDDLPAGAETIDLQNLTVTLSNGQSWKDTATLNAGTLTTSGSSVEGGTVRLTYDIAYDDDNVIGFYLDDPAPGTKVKWDDYDDTTGKEIVTDAVDGLNQIDHTGSGKTHPWIEIVGSFDGFGSPDQTEDVIGALTDVGGWTYAIGSTSGAYAFLNATHLKQVDTLPNTLTDASFMFKDAGTAAESLYIGSWNSSNVTTMAHMFDGATSFDQDNISWDTSNVEDMSYMLAGATSFVGPIRFSSTANVTAMEGMFRGATSYTGGTWDGHGID